MINFPHELISNFNLHTLNVKIYFKPKYSNEDPSGTAKFFRNLQTAMSPYIGSSPQASDIPRILQSLSQFDNITKTEIINPMNLNGYSVTFE